MNLQEELRSCISRMIDPQEAESTQSRLLEILIQVGEEPFFEAIDGVIQSVDGSLQSHACGFAVRIRPKSKYAEKARRVLAENLARGSLDDQLHTAFILFFNEAASECHVPHLLTIWDNTACSDNRRLWAAGAIFHGASPNGPYGEVRLRMMGELRSALQSADLYGVLMASLAFRRDHIHQGESEKALLHAAQVAESDFRLVLIGQLVRACGPSPSVVEYLVSVAQNENEETAARVHAIIALARTPKDLNNVSRMLMELLSSSNWSIVANAVNAISERNGRLPNELVEVLVGFLGHEEVNIRGTAVRSLLDAGREVLVTRLPDLVHRLAVEVDEAVLEALVVAIGSTGIEALPLLERAIDVSPLSRIVYYQYTLFVIGRRSAAEVAGLMESDSTRVRTATAWALQSMASDAAPAVGVLQRLLQSEDQDVLRDVLISMRQIGPSALPATQSLARLLGHADESIRDWARDTILTIGPCATSELKLAQSAAPKDLRDSIDQLLQRLGEIVLPEVSKNTVMSIDGANDEDLLDRFVLAGEVLNQTGPLSFAKLEEVLATKSPNKSVSASTLRRTIDALERQWSEFTGRNIVLIDRKKNAKGGITKDGNLYLKRAQDFLDQMRASRLPKN